MHPTYDKALVWLRRDLRTDDNAALYHALRSSRQAWCAFVFDRAILDPLLAAGRQQDRRVEFIRDSLVGVDAGLRALAASHGVDGAGLIVRHGDAADEVAALAQQLGVQAVYASHDDEPAALARDARVRGLLAERGIALHTSKDHVVFERSEVLTAAGTPYAMFTPYREAWLRKCDAYFLSAYPVARHAGALAPLPEADAARGIPALQAIGFKRTNLHELRLPSGPAGANEMLAEFEERIDRYHEARDYPAVKGPSYLGPHLRFGTVSVRRLARGAHARMVGGSRGAEVWLQELIWRDFFNQVLHHHPRVVEHAFKPEYDRIAWEHGKAGQARLDAWSEGRTGIPLVDAAMAQLHQTGYMHNRLRMVTASFLCKQLGVDWRRGEAHFALHLNDYDLASNNGSWQWAASTGCDAQPYFRVFNPVTQSRRFDPEGRFIRRYLPQLASLSDELIHAPWEARPVDLAAARLELGRDYPLPVVDLAIARERAIERYAAARRS